MITFDSVTKTITVTADDGTTTVYTPDLYDQYIIDTGRVEDIEAILSIQPLTLEQEISIKKEAIDSLYLEKLYTNKTALFPSGTKIVQLRDENDYRFFERITYSAITRKSTQQDDATVTFRTEDNADQVVAASEFIPIALDILDACQALWDIRTAHRDFVGTLTTIDEVRYYDYSTGWPESNEPVWVMKERSSKIYKAMIRRRASDLFSAGKTVESIALLKTIGE